MDFSDCPCSGKTLARLLNPAIMLCLARGPAHGYSLVQQLGALKMFASGEPDPAGVYRTLKQMESQNLVSAEWETGVGPARRVFSLTPDGAACLDRWMQTLATYREAIDDLLDQMPACGQNT